MSKPSVFNLRKAAANIPQARILIVDDHPLMRLAVREIINGESDMLVCGEAATAALALEQLEATQPHLVLLDLSLGDDFGLDLIKQIMKQDSSRRVLVLSIYDEALYAERALRAGAMGYLNKREQPETILTAIRSVLSGKIYLQPALIDQFLHRLNGVSKGPAGGNEVDRLSDREIQTFELLGMGVGCREIAKRMGLSVKTVEAYRERIKEKLRVETSAELMRRAVEWVLSQA